MSRTYPASRSVTVNRTETIQAAEREERTYRTVIETPREGAYSVRVCRENIWKAEDGTILDARPIEATLLRVASGIAEESVTLADGTVITAAAVIESLPLFFDRWADEDIAAGRR